MTKVLKHNYHTHTARCHHASGTDEEYVLSAIKHGMKELGFSDHIPWSTHPGDKYRMDVSEVQDYFNSINELKEKYKDQIKIYVGFESEFILAEQDYYKYLFENKLIDYMILGAHCHDYIDLDHSVESNPNKDNIIEYAHHCAKQMSTGMFKYLAHPDVFMRRYGDFDEICEEVAHIICKASKENNFPIEVNGGGISKGIKEINGKERYLYPVEEFWKIASEYQCPVVIGADAHHPESLNNEIIQLAFEWAEKYNLNLIKDNKIEI